MAEQEGLTSQEAAFFESGGTQTEGLDTAAQPEAQTQQTETQPEQQTEQHDQTQNQEPRTVPLAALREEREERKRLRDELNQVRSQTDALVARILHAQQPQQEQQPQIPDYSQDPVGHLRAQNELLQRQLGQVTNYLNGQHQQSQQYTEQQAVVQQMQDFLVADEAKFRTQAPDYDAAASFLQNSRASEYKALGMNNPAEISRALQQDLMAMVNIARHNGTSVAEAAYTLAKARGYKGAQQPQQQEGAAKIAAINQGQQHAASLSQAGGGAAPPMSVERLLAMDDAEFAKATSGMSWQKLNAELSR